MQKEMITQYSQALNQEMHVMVYGHGGVPFLCFPTQDSMCRNYEDFGMTDQLADFIDGGRIQLFVVDTVDRESWSAKNGIPEWRAARQEQYFHYIVDEVRQLVSHPEILVVAAQGVLRGKTQEGHAAPSVNHHMHLPVQRPAVLGHHFLLHGPSSPCHRSCKTAAW